MNQTSEILIVVLLSLGITIAIALALREFFCWYWKINQRIALLKELQTALTQRSLKNAPEAEGISGDGSITEKKRV